MNHPNFKWSIGAEELLAVDGYRFVEIYNGHPASNNDGGGGLPSTYNIWDRLLSAGRQVWGIAVDDSHHFQRQFGPERSNPGRGWVQVRNGQTGSRRDPAGPGRRGFLCFHRCDACRSTVHIRVRLPSKLNRVMRRSSQRCSRGKGARSCTCRTHLHRGTVLRGWMATCGRRFTRRVERRPGRSRCSSRVADAGRDFAIGLKSAEAAVRPWPVPIK